jgi:hypothetical protein
MKAFEIIGVMVVGVLLYRGVYVTLLGWTQTRARIRREQQQDKKGKNDGFF